jgi:hypothetical protein
VGSHRSCRVPLGNERGLQDSEHGVKGKGDMTDSEALRGERG